MVTNNELDKLLNQAGTTARLGSEKHCRDLLQEIEASYELARRSTSGSDETQSVKVDERAILRKLVTALDGKRAAGIVGDPGFEFNDQLWALLEPARAALAQQATTASASIDHDPEFQRLAEAWRAEPYGTRAFLTTWDALVAHIDSRAPAPSRDAASDAPAAEDVRDAGEFAHIEALSRATTQPRTPVYQVWKASGDGCWMDTDKASYDKTSPESYRRIVYVATMSASQGKTEEAK